MAEQIGDATLHCGDARAVLATLPERSIQSCITSPPYFGLRNYLDAAGQIGLEQSPDEYVAALAAVFRAVRRVLRDDGTLWLNLGDSYAGSWGNYSGHNRGKGGQRNISVGSLPAPAWDGREQERPAASRKMDGIKEKDLIGIPWMVAFALRADGWYLRSDIIWHKPNPMPESVRDRPTKSHEYLFLLAKSERYYYDADAIREPHTTPDGMGWAAHGKGARYSTSAYGAHRGAADFSRSGEGLQAMGGHPKGRNKRSVWTIATRPFSARKLGIDDVDHFAAYPPDLVRPCVLAGCPRGGTVLDAFCGSGTTGLVALQEGRAFVGIDLNADYLRIARARLLAPRQTTLAEVS